MRSVRPMFFLPNLRSGGAEIVTLNVISGIVERGGWAGLCMLKKNIIEHRIPKNLELNGRYVFPKFDRCSRDQKSGFIKQIISCDMLVGALEIKIHLVTVILGFIFRRPVILWLHKDLSAFLEKKNLFSRLIYEFALKVNLKFAKRIVVVSSGAAASLMAICPDAADKIVRIYNPVDFSYIDSKKNEKFEPPWGGERFILAVGRLIWEKGFDTLIDAFHMVALKNPELKLVILGEGKRRVSLEQKITRSGLMGRVYLPGFDSPYSAMSQAAMLVCSSRSEGLSMVLIEGLYCGARIVSTDCPSGPSEVLASGKYGVMVEVDKPDLLANAMLDVLVATDNLDNKDARQARAKDFSFERIIPEWESLICSIL